MARGWSSPPNPMAQTSSGAVASMAVMLIRSAVAGISTGFQVLPSQCRRRGLNIPDSGTQYQPPAQASFAEMAATCCPAEQFSGTGMSADFQDVPSQCDAGAVLPLL